MIDADDSGWGLAVDRLVEGQHSIKVLPHFSSAELATYDQAAEEISEFKTSLRLAWSLQANRDDLLRCLAKMAQHFFEHRSMGPEEMDGAIAEFGRLFMNVLGMFRIFLEHTKASLITRFGEGSPQYARWKAKTAESWDGSAAYRLFDKMRNYAVHYGLPSNFVQFQCGCNRRTRKLGYQLQS